MMNSLQTKKREYLLYVLSAATFIIFFQLYMVAPLLPSLSVFFNVSEQTIGLIVPAYLIPYGISTLFYGLLADKIGTKKVVLSSLFVFVVLTALTSFSQSVPQLITWRLLTGIGASGVVPMALAWTGRSYSYEERGRPLGWIFGAMAGGGAFGASAGVILESYIGWRMLFLGVSILGVLTWTILWLAFRNLGDVLMEKQKLTLTKVLNGYKALFSGRRGKIAYTYVLLNGIFHAGVFTWLGLYFEESFGLSGASIGFAIIGYGFPGFILGPFIGKLVDKKGRNKLLPIGLAISALSAIILSFNIPLYVATIAVVLLSLGYDLTQPLLAGIITEIGKERTGQAMSLNVFMLFIGFGLGSYLFGLALQLSLLQALTIFSVVQATLSIMAIALFRGEMKIKSLSKY
ncbi:MFS transporter [Empedobacter brevis]|uniref:MFS transporter n=4 Tax=Weeksellaceae TaxID=2762318 RepID=A0A3G8WE49_9FLAO|nr:MULTISPECIES: MFS transporter [Bacteroidota]MBN9485567.1 MFS transporter [Bacteroidota bacterium]UTG61706.1 MFS transporter [Elizabethkingia anophelis]AZI19392.1 MFS transporter [Chryseobacterium taklimakanense]AZI38803.1 MFS transporter [Epilithonimonas vandammei]MDM1072610.1 MFS transporter [Empedobacter brevis]